MISLSLSLSLSLPPRETAGRNGPVVEKTQGVKHGKGPRHGNMETWKHGKGAKGVSAQTI